MHQEQHNDFKLFALVTGELVVIEVRDVSGGPVEEEPDLLHRGVGLEDLIDGEGVPADGEGEEVGLGGAGLAEDVKHGGVGELVVLEVGDACGGPVEEEPGLLHRGVGFEDLVDGEGVPADGEGEEVGLGGGPGGGAEGRRS
ncbi:uncharacterized protein A4U43_C01F9110 [Asparagus officinalis]|uniref:Uncharacterized protein n=1 Tax=Asparagus officinalis TaxID=4686 RepID=A0A5P1FN12_ASPOF|nr:uncharacterized protein A4U43_C01F9110 [Asparagus officinalis]